MFHKMPILLIILIASVLLLQPVMPLMAQQMMYTVAVNIKEIIIFCLPIIIFTLLFKVAVTLSARATGIIIGVLALVCCSNFCSTYASHFVGQWVYHFDLTVLPPRSASDLSVLWSMHLPKLIANNHAMFSGIISGLLLSRWQPQRALKWVEKADKVVDNLLHGLLFVIPLFVVGFVVKLQYDGVLQLIIKDYAKIALIVALSQYAYLALAYTLLSRGNIQKALTRMKNMLPAAICGFCTMSSAASMPLLFMGAQRNTKDPDLSKSVIPATVNIHLVGDCFAIPIFAYAVLKSFGMSEPTTLQYLIFTLYFVVAKFSVAAIPGGGILVMLPILQSQLGFNTEMMSLISALYILFDPVITSANVFGNGAMAQLVDKIVHARRQQTAQASAT